MRHFSRCLALALAVMLFCAPAALGEAPADSLAKLIKDFESLKLPDAVTAARKDFAGWSAEKQVAFLVGTRFLTEAESVGSYYLYFRAHGDVSSAMAPTLMKGLKSSDASIRLYCLKLLDIIRPAVLGRELSQIALYDADDRTAFYAMRMIGFYGTDDPAGELSRCAKTKEGRREELLFRLAASSAVDRAAVEAVVAGWGKTSVEAIAALASVKSPKAFEMAESPEGILLLRSGWIWSFLASADPARACELFILAVIPYVKEADISEPLDNLFTEAGTRTPDAATKVAEAFKAKKMTEAYLRALAAISSSDAAAKLRNAVLTDSEPLHAFQSTRYLLSTGDYSAVPELLKLLESEKVKAYPRRKSWAATMLSYFGARECAAILETSFKEATDTTGRASSLAAMSRIDPARAAALIGPVVDEWIAAWKKAWESDPASDYNTSGLPELYRAMLSLRAAASELPPDAGLGVLDKLMAACEPHFRAELYSGYNWWPGNPRARALLSGVGGSSVAEVVAAANALGFIGEDADVKKMLASDSSGSLAVADAQLAAAAAIACLPAPTGKLSATARLAALLKSLSTARFAPADTGRAALGAPATNDDAFWKTAAAALRKASDNPGLTTAILRSLSTDLGVRFVHIPDYHFNYLRHDTAAVLRGCYLARKVVEGKK
ncbi:MAG: hypothetical protein WC712_07035 [Candidatus Brocadiia bacterium]